MLRHARCLFSTNKGIKLPLITIRQEPVVPPERCNISLILKVIIVLSWLTDYSIWPDPNVNAELSRGICSRWNRCILGGGGGRPSPSLAPCRCSPSRFFHNHERPTVSSYFQVPNQISLPSSDPASSSSSRISSPQMTSFVSLPTLCFTFS